MDQLTPAYLAALASQLGFLSAFLGGFAATLTAMILQTGSPRRIAGWAMALAAMAATAFVVAAVATTSVTSGAHPDAPTAVTAAGPLERARIIAAAGFALGCYLILAAIGCSGWLRSRKVGWVTTGAAGVAVVLVTLIFAGV